MRRRISLDGSLLVLIFFTVFTILPSVAAATCERPGSVAITDQTRDAATAANIPDFCTHWIPGQPYVGQNAGEAKAYLTTLGRAGSCRTASPEAFQQLNNAFAICASRFFREYQARYGSVYITSAYRSPGPGGSNQCAGGVDGSNHTRGVAIDVHPKSGDYDSMMNFARANRQLGVCFPRPMYRGNPDLPHMVIGGLQGTEGARCAAQGITQACDGVNFDPNSIQAAAPSSPSPTTAFANTVRQAFGLPTQQNQVSVAQPAFPSQPVSSSQSPISAFNEPQVAPGVSKQINTPVNTTGGSSTVADRLEELAFGPKPATSTTATSVPLVVSGSNAATLTSTQNPTTASTSGVTGITTPVQQTFTSGDLSWQGESVSSSPVSGMTAILITLKSALTRLLQYLTPFGSRGQINVGGDVEMVE